MLSLLLLLALSAPGVAARKGRRGKGRAAAGAKAKDREKEKPARKEKAPPPAPAPPPVEEASPRPRGGEDERELRRGERVEFDGRLIEGQTAASGAIYLFERLPSELRSMVPERQSYRREVLETLYPNGVVPAEADPRRDRGGAR